MPTDAPVDVEEVLRLDREATAGPWTSDLDAIPFNPRQKSSFADWGASICGPKGCDIIIGGAQDEQGGAVGVLRNEDALFVIKSRTACPALARELKQCREMLRDLIARGRPFDEEFLHDSGYQSALAAHERAVAYLAKIGGQS